MNYFIIICPYIHVSANFSQNDISDIVAEPKSTIEETIKNPTTPKSQKIINCGSQNVYTTPKKSNEPCHSIILLF